MRQSNSEKQKKEINSVGKKQKEVQSFSKVHLQSPDKEEESASKGDTWLNIKFPN